MRQEAAGAAREAEEEEEELLLRRLLSPLFPFRLRLLLLLLRGLRPRMRGCTGGLTDEFEREGEREEKDFVLKKTIFPFFSKKEKKRKKREKKTLLHSSPSSHALPLLPPFLDLPPKNNGALPRLCLRPRGRGRPVRVAELCGEQQPVSSLEREERE